MDIQMVIHIVNLKLLDRVRGLSRMPYRFPIPMKFPTALAAALSAAAFSPSAHAAAYSIIATNSQTVGSTATVTGSGSKSNTTAWETGVVAEYIISDEFGQQYGMRVSISNPTGTLTAGTDSLMVARTVDSQGLVDPGTLSVYVNPGDTTTTTGAWSLDLNFSFYDAAFENSVAVDLLLTSLDIDAGQKYYTSDADFAGNLLYEDTNISSDSTFAGYSGFTATGNSSFSDAEHAVSSQGLSQSSFDVRVSHNNVALFMFEFRDPSQIVPEPSASALAMLGAAALLRRRRRP